MIIALLYYENEKKLYFDLTKTKMENVVSNISSQVIYSHMSGTKLDSSSFMNKSEYKISFYDKNRKKLFGNLDGNIDFSKKIIVQDRNFTLINNSTYGHLGIYYIAIEENLYAKTIDKLKSNTIFIFILIFTFISLIGFYLAKLFIKPIKDEREKLNTFIKDSTHELNTPVSAILMSTEDTELSKKQIDRIKLAAKRISEVYQDLTFVFLEEHEKNPQLENHRLDQLIEEQLPYFKILAHKKRVTISCELKEFEYKIQRDDFIRLFNNILSNAIKYNKKQGNINIKLKSNVLVIDDSGVGIPKDKIKDIFNRYYRATKEQGGFGIGLNIVQNICYKYNIKFHVESKLKEGTTFSFKFN
ncbi:MAG: sensor histidine kinase [Halarcobacter sp.]